MRIFLSISSRFVLLIILLQTFFIVTAQTTDTLRMKGLREPVEVWRDEWGMNHIYARNEHDLFFAQGYCAARDRLFQFELWRLQATGTLAAVLGPSALQRYIGARLFKYRGDMNKELSHYHKNGGQIINAFVAGVNTYIGQALQSPSLLPFEFEMLGIKPGLWTAETVVSRHQGIIGNVAEELNIGRAVALAGEKKVKDLYWFHPQDPDLKMDTMVSGALQSPDILSVLRSFRLELTPNELAAGMVDTRKKELASITPASLSGTDEPLTERGIEGSNNWVISGRRSASGYPLLADDPHRRLSLPSLRYMVHLQAPGWNVIGSGEPAIPGVSIGHNEKGAWGITVFETDAEDLYVYNLRPGHPDQYMHKGQWHRMKRVQERILIKGKADTLVTLYYTVHGPVTYIDITLGKAYAVRSAALEPGGAPYLSALRIDQAGDWTSFREACSYSHVPALNMVWADKSGHIGWQVVGIIPQRTTHSGLVPVPGDGRFEWGAYLPIRQRPNTVDPAKGYWATANQNLAPANYKHWEAMGYTWPDAFRGQRIDDVLSNDSIVTLDEMKALQTDYISLPARSLVPLLQNLPVDTGLYQQARDLFTGWNYELAISSKAAAVYVMWERKIMEQAAQRWIPSPLQGLLRFQFTKVWGWLLNPDAEHFGEETTAERNRFLATTFRMAVNALTVQLGPAVKDWQYGQAAFKHSQLLHPLQQWVSDSIRPQINTPLLPRGGYGHTIGSTGDANNQATGATFRIVTDTGNWDNTWMTNAPGQSGDPRSPYYRNLFEPWARDSYFPAYYTRDKLKPHVASILLLTPAKESR